MKVIAFLVFSALAVYAASEDDTVTSEKLEKVFSNIFLKREAKYHDNGTVYEKESREIPLKKENVDILIVLKERKVYTRKVIIDAKSEVKDNNFNLNASAIFLDVQEDGVVQINGTVDQKAVNETGKLSIHWNKWRDSWLIKRGEFNATHVTPLELAPESEWSIGYVKLSVADVIEKYVTNADLMKALNDCMEDILKHYKASVADYDPSDPDSMSMNRFQDAYKKVINA